jgi:hypothetical protein
MYTVLECASWHIVQQRHGRLRLCLCQAYIVTLIHALRMETAQKISHILSASLHFSGGRSTTSPYVCMR